ncbi:cysteine lyase [Alicyclobacillus contaminans]|uniref:aminotransferase class V-fold PLP-dependent enzyme n=1 Tax=Alicyclobacillus contaminans TaxID=392016 RepID=UPI000407BBB6|nr:aminotransferase class V-fold PLP-dependent enzyme [Alicyclobacillus contaminans]GMA51994.1 cysteine lyase [Alicyclobacillus contaminans]
MAHVDNLRRHFPAIRTVAYLNTGEFGALPDTAVSAMQEELRWQLEQGRLHDDWDTRFQQIRAEVREHLAVLLDAPPEAFALTDGATHAVNIALWGLPLRAGDEILYTDLEHPAVLLPLQILKQRRGVVLQKVPVATSEDQWLTQVQRLLTPRTRLLVIPHVAAATGQRLPVETLCELIHRHGGYCLVDGAQGAGAEPFSLAQSGVDLYAVSGRKWLCGPDGTGALYVAPTLQSVLDPTFIGPAALASPHAYTALGHHLAAETGQRFEYAASARVQWIGFHESLKFLRVHVGWDYAYTRIQGLSAHLFDQLLDFPNVQIVTPREARAGIVSFRLPHPSAEAFVAAADERSVHVQAVPNRNLIRVSCGFYNHEDDIERLLAVLRSVR